MYLRRSVCFILFILSATASICAASDPTIGIVWLHGKGGYPSDPYMTGLSNKMRDSGFLVTAPEMPYSKNRQYDKTYQDSANEIDKEIAYLKGKGAQKIFVAGLSLGANVALNYAARTSVDGVLAIAPGHTPESKIMRTRLGSEVERARKMIQDGQGDKRAMFDDINQGKISSVSTTANIYFSWFDPDGQAVMPKNAAALKPGTALLLVIGKKDPLYQAGQSYVFDKAPPNPNNKYLEVDSDHVDTPTVAANDIVNWIKGIK